MESKNKSDEIYKEQFPDIGVFLKKKTNDICSVKTLTNRLPIIHWLPKYKASFLIEDFVAGLTVGLTAIPQAIAYGVIAGLPPQYGLYSAFMGCFVYIIFGSCKDVTVGPTAIMSLMVQAHVSDNPDYAVLACFLSGCIILLLGILNLGVLVRFISVPVVTGFTTAAAITIGSGQINSLFGVASKSNEFIDSWENIFTHLNEIRLNDSLLGVITLICLIILRKFKDAKFVPKAVAKYVSLSRNALAVIIGILLSYFLSRDGYEPFKLTGRIASGLPPFQLPPFSTVESDGKEMGFSDMVGELGSSLITIPLISILEVVAIAKAFSRGKSVDASQEMIAVGLCNFLGSFVLSMPITGSFSRSAINNASGVQTVLGGAVTGSLVLLTLAFLTSTFYYIPKASLAAIIIAAMIFMVEYERIAEIWRAKRMDMFPFLVTLSSCLFLGLEYGMIIGVGFNLIYILYESAQPVVIIHSETIGGIEVTVVKSHDDLKYASAEYMKEKIINVIRKNNNNSKIILLDGVEIFSIDSTVAMNLVILKKDLESNDCELLFWNWEVKTAGVVCRWEPSIKNSFVYGKTVEEVTKEQWKGLQLIEPDP